MEFNAGLMEFNAGLMEFNAPSLGIFRGFFGDVADFLGIFWGIFGELSGGGPGAAAPDLPPLWAPDPGLRPARDT